MKNDIRFAFFGSSQFSQYVLEELQKVGYTPALSITSARDPLPLETLRKLEADVFIVASFGKILTEEIISMPKHKTLNVHPSLLPRLRGASPIQGAILSGKKTGVSIMRLDEKMDHGPLLAQRKVTITPWPDHYGVVEKKLGQAGGELLSEILPQWIEGKIPEIPQDESQATYTKMFKKEDGLLDLNDDSETNFRKILAFSTWPGAYFFHERKDGKKIRVRVTDAELENCDIENSLKTENCKLKIVSIVPEGKKEMLWADFLRGNL